LDAGVFLDQSGFDNDATISGSPVLVEPVAAMGGGAVLVSNSTSITFPWQNAFRAGKETHPFTLECWIKPINQTGTFTLGRGGKGILLSGNIVTFDLGGFNSISEYIDQGEGHHIVAVYNNTMMSLYVDGDLVDDTIVENVDFSNLTGAFTASVASGRQVVLDTVVVYPYTVPGTAIKDHYVKSVAYYDIASNVASQAALYFRFDDRRLPVAKQQIAEYPGILDNFVVVENQLQQVYDPETADYPTSTYLHLIQFDDMVTGTAKQARVDWEVIGDPSRVTVESSKDGTSWAAVTNHGMTTNLDDTLTNNDFFIRVTASGGATDVTIEDFAVTMYNTTIQYTSNDTAVKATLTGTGTTGYVESIPGAFRERDGITLAANAYLTIDAHPDFGNVGTVEIIGKNLNGQGTIFEQGTNRIYRDGTGIHFTGFTRLVIDGQNIANNDTTISTRVGFRHIVATLTTPSNAVAYLGARSAGANPLAGNPTFSHVALYAEQKSLAEATDTYRAYVGGAPARVDDSSQILVSEYIWDNNEHFKMYSFDWAQVAGG
jgi:hypothetical protein